MSFDRAFQIVVEAEGGYVNDPADPGGETIYGITKRDHPDLWATGRPTLEQAKDRYRRDYWDPVKGDRLPWPLACFVFDSAVNQGGTPGVCEITKKLLQKALGVAQDGLLGPATMKAIERANQTELGALFLVDRALRYVGTRNFDRYGRGWLKRLFAVQEAVCRLP